MRIRNTSECVSDGLTKQKEENTVLYYTLVFLVIALIAGMLGFGMIAFASAEIARICFFIFLVAFIVSLVAHVARRAH